MDEFPLEDELDHTILMHRDAHFGGSFSLMLSYYKGEGKGILPDIEIERIEYLESMEKAANTNLSEIYLDDAEKEEVLRAKEKYWTLRSIYEKGSSDSIACLIADLILSEKDEPEEEIAQLVNKGKDAVPALIDLISQIDFYNPLFPGYGTAPASAARALGLIGDPRAIAPLFEALGKGDFFTEEAIVGALHSLGKPAQDFLLKRLCAAPITQENEHAAIALSHHADPEIASASFALLRSLDIKKYPRLAMYLVLSCIELKSPEEREAFKKMSMDGAIPSDIREEIVSISYNW